jgi:SAM-dependent methyltransferase
LVRSPEKFSMTSMEHNAYSPRWFEFFHVGIDEARTSQEAMFVSRCAPLPEFRKVVDMCCGMGRHARALASRGYSVTGVDRDAKAIAKARERRGGPNYVVADVRDYLPEPEGFDVAIVMGQSFGYFDPSTNREVLGRLTGGVRQGGRVVLDLWNREFFAAHQGEREIKTPNGIVQETKHMDGDRLFVQLDYPDGGQDQFEWQLFAPAQMEQLAQSLDSEVVLCCSDFDTTNLPSPTKPRIQFVLERCRV